MGCSSGNYDFYSTVALAAGIPSPITHTLIPDTVTPPNDEAILTLTDLHSGSSLMPGERYTIPITAAGGGITHTAGVSLLVGGARVYLPLIVK